MGKDERDACSNMDNGKSFWDIVDKNGKAIQKKDTLVDNIICINKKSKNNLTNITVTVFLVSSTLIYLRPSDNLAKNTLPWIYNEH